MGLNPFVQMAKFGCAPHYIRLAAFLSALNPSISCSGSWYLNVILEPPTNLQQLRRLRRSSSSSQLLHRQQHQQRRQHPETISFTTSCLPAACFSCVPSWSSCASDFPAMHSSCCCLRPINTHVTCAVTSTRPRGSRRRELRDFESSAAFSSAPETALASHDVVLPLSLLICPPVPAYLSDHPIRDDHSCVNLESMESSCGSPHRILS